MKRLTLSHPKCRSNSIRVRNQARTSSGSIVKGKRRHRCSSTLTCATNNVATHPEKASARSTSNWISKKRICGCLIWFRILIVRWRSSWTYKTTTWNWTSSYNVAATRFRGRNLINQPNKLNGVPNKNKIKFWTKVTSRNQIDKIHLNISIMEQS